MILLGKRSWSGKSAGIASALTITGSVLDSGEAAVASCGKVELWNSGGTVLLNVVNVDGSGNYSFTGLAAGSYRVMLHPSLPFCVAAAEPDALTSSPTVAPSVSAGSTYSFHVTASVFHYDYQQFTSDANQRSTIFTDQGLEVAGLGANTGQIFLDATGGKGGLKAARYDWPTPGAPLCDSYSLKFGGRKTPSPTTTSDWWLVWRDKYTSPWVNGNPSCAGSESFEYKVLLYGTAGGGPVAELLMFGGHTSSPNIVLTFTIVGTGGSWSNAQQTPTGQYSLGTSGSSFFGQYHRFVEHLSKFDGSSTDWAARLRIDNVERLFLLGTAASTPFANANTWTQIELGANINSKPDPTSRWWDRVGLYKTRPALIEVD